MSFCIEQKFLAEMLGLAVRIPASRNTIPILECARLSFNKTGLSIAATDMEKWLTLTTEDYKEKESDIACIPVRQLHSLVSAIDKDQKITLSFAGKRLTIKAGSSKYTFGSLPDSDWPTYDMAKESVAVNASAQEMIDAFGFTMTCAGRDDSRYYLNGVCLNMHKDSLRLLSSDGHQAAWFTAGFKPAKKIPESIISRDVVGIFLDLLNRTEPDSNVDLSLSPHMVQINCACAFKINLVSKLIDGTFPDLDRVAPCGQEKISVTLPREQTIKSLARLASVIVTLEGNAIFLDISGDTVKMGVPKNAQSEAEEIIKTSAVSKGAIKIGVSVHLLSSVLSAFNDDTLVLHITDESAPIMIAPVGVTPAPDAKFAIVMPMRI